MARLPSIPIRSFFGNIYIDVSILLVIGIIVFYTGWYARVKPFPNNLGGGTFIYKDFVGQTRNLSPFFAQIEPDMRDYYLDNDVQVKFPLAALY